MLSRGTCIQDLLLMRAPPGDFLLRGPQLLWRGQLQQFAIRWRWGDLHSSEELLWADTRGKTPDRGGEPLAHLREMRETGPRRSWCVVRLSVHVKCKNKQTFTHFP